MKVIIFLLSVIALPLYAVGIIIDTIIIIKCLKGDAAI